MIRSLFQFISAAPSTSRVMAIGLLLAIPLLSGCDRVLGGGHANLDRLEVFVSGTSPQTTVATWTQSGGWDVAALPTISLSSGQGQSSLGVRVFEEDGAPVSLVLGGEYFIRYRLAPSAQEGILNMSLPASQLFFGDRVQLVASAAGTTSVRFSLFHVNHSDGDTTPISVNVVP